MRKSSGQCFGVVRRRKILSWELLQRLGWPTKVNHHCSIHQHVPRTGHSFPVAQGRPVLSILKPATETTKPSEFLCGAKTPDHGCCIPELTLFGGRGRGNSGAVNQKGDRGLKIQLNVFHRTCCAAWRCDRDASRHWLVHVPPQGRGCTAAVNPSTRSQEILEIDNKCKAIAPIDRKIRFCC